MGSYSRLKFDSPENTVLNIKNCLNGSPLNLQETILSGGSTSCYSVAITDSVTGISTYGKGVTKELALASGYAEFIEYLQGLILVNPSKYISDSKLLGDDVELTASEIWEQAKRPFSIAKISQQKVDLVLEPKSSDEKFLCHKFTDIITGETCYIPIKFFWLVGNSSGMASGNTKEEALQHALAESIERKTMQMVLCSGFTGTLLTQDSYKVYDDIKAITDILDSQEVRYFVFDCSFGGKVPTIMLVLMNKFGQYKANFAASASFPVAVERCFTEVFQGFDITKANEVINWEDGKVEIEDYPNFRDAVSLGNYKIMEQHYAACFNDPVTYFGTSPEKLSDYVDHLKSIQDLPIESILFREISFLGFNTVQIIALPTSIFFMPLGFYPSAKCRNSLLEHKFDITVDNFKPIFNHLRRNHIFYDKLRHDLNDVMLLAILSALCGDNYIYTSYNCYRDFCKISQENSDLFKRLFIIKDFGCSEDEFNALLDKANSFVDRENVFNKQEETLANWLLTRSTTYIQPEYSDMSNLILVPHEEVV